MVDCIKHQDEAKTSFPCVILEHVTKFYVQLRQGFATPVSSIVPQVAQSLSNIVDDRFEEMSSRDALISVHHCIPKSRNLSANITEERCCYSCFSGGLDSMDREVSAGRSRGLLVVSESVQLGDCRKCICTEMRVANDRIWRSRQGKD